MSSERVSVSDLASSASRSCVYMCFFTPLLCTLQRCNDTTIQRSPLLVSHLAGTAGSAEHDAEVDTPLGGPLDSACHFECVCG